MMTSIIFNALLSSAIFGLFYKLVLESTDNHQFKRLFLILSLLLPFIIPTLKFAPSRLSPIHHEQIIPVNISNYASGISENLKFKNDETTVAKSIQFEPINALIIMYFCISFVLLWRFLMNFQNMNRLIKASEIVEFDQYKLVLNNDINTPFSFFDYLFFNKEEYELFGIDRRILLHELTHIKEKHTIDIALFELVNIVFWFNPMLQFLKKHIQLNHEFIADKAVLSQYNDVNAYQCLILAKSQTFFIHSMTSNFNFSFTKKRLIMMTSTSSVKTKFAKAFFSLILIIFCFYFFSNKIEAQTTSDNFSSSKISSLKGTGISEIELTMLNVLIDSKNIPKNGRSVNLNYFTDSELSYFDEVFFKMTYDQKLRCKITYTKPEAIRPNTISNEEYENYKKPNLYGVWLHGKHVDNAVLNNYVASDFSSSFISKLYGAAKVGRKYTHQLDLMTHKEYEKYLEEFKKAKYLPTIFLNSQC